MLLLIWYTAPKVLFSHTYINFCYRLLQISSFNGKMNALNEVNKVISSVSYYTHRHGNPEEEEWLTAERMAVSSPHQNSLNVFSFSVNFSCRSSSVLQILHMLLIFISSVINSRYVIIRSYFNSSLSVKNCCIFFQSCSWELSSVLLKTYFKKRSQIVYYLCSVLGFILNPKLK